MFVYDSFLLSKSLPLHSPAILSVSAVQSEIMMLLNYKPQKETPPWLTVVTYLCWVKSETAVNNFISLLCL
jgi:hypothetical protein